MFRVIFVFHAVLYFLMASSSEKIAEKSPKSPRVDGYFAQHDLCESEIASAEKKYGIPHRLFMAIGTVESGRSVDSQPKRPYPWTICAAGKSYYFSTKSAAIAAVKRLMARGKRNIDVGCMQVNLLHHSNAFRTLEEAFTPKYNVDYAARFFIDLKNTYSSWTHAVGYYHSRAAKYYKPYCTVVYNTWTNVKNRKVNASSGVQLASSEIKSKISFLPSYYSLVDSKISAKLHQLGRKTLNRSSPKFFYKQ
ncbi:MAG: transglycosylase SLT domain-containing protein [Holosporaceae bacterium]|nr:transglycosylase SLT domain-containing protein [Holosporaceae bacterium]